MSEPTCVVTDATSGVDVPADGAALKGRSGLARIWYASGYSAAGLKAAYRGEAAFRQLVLLNLLLIPLAFLFDVSRVERAVLIAVVFLGLIVELLNSAIEATVDRMFRMRHADGRWIWLRARAELVDRDTSVKGAEDKARHEAQKEAEANA